MDIFQGYCLFLCATVSRALRGRYRRTGYLGTPTRRVPSIFLVLGGLGALLDLDFHSVKCCLTKFPDEVRTIGLSNQITHQFSTMSLRSSASQMMFSIDFSEVINGRIGIRFGVSESNRNMFCISIIEICLPFSRQF